jgi:hypothetical protein
VRGLRSPRGPLGVDGTGRGPNWPSRIERVMTSPVLMGIQSTALWPPPRGRERVYGWGSHGAREGRGSKSLDRSHLELSVRFIPLL